MCQNKIQAHSEATEREIADALEYAVDTGNVIPRHPNNNKKSEQKFHRNFPVPTLIWKDMDTSASLFLGGYKAALNSDFLLGNGIKLVVNAAPSLTKVLGPRYVERRRKLWEELARRAVEEVTLDWEDSLGQRLKEEELHFAVTIIKQSLDKGIKKTESINFF